MEEEIEETMDDEKKISVRRPTDRDLLEIHRILTTRDDASIRVTIALLRHVTR